ncbi:TetR/AcrR family transcriptional regulator [Frankia sp. R82]|uniref:TetR/AcrR family transcriptional regulator n=1 Tax=Frankia sp. R82 TaxID=2950553 RepID=UPI002043C97E|nr:TetR/AcrR family transcriptional regulator [Frankia sp. R82]MCM3885543.1 TetR/AcrR family transcriptional regulator [Frankia sp. R82]
MADAAVPSLRDRVITAAGQLFYADGYGVTIDAVAQQAGVAKPTVYAHFGSKESLIEATLVRGVEEFFADLALEVTRHDGDPVAQLLAPFDLLAKGLPDPEYHGCICINAAASFPRTDHPAHAVLLSLDARMIEEFERLGRAAGARQPVLLARQLLVLFDGVKARGLSDSSDQPARDARAAARALLAAAS